MKKILFNEFAAGVGNCAMSQTVPSMSALHDGIHHWNLEHKERNCKRYSPEQYTKIADNFVAYQNEDGGWPKNIDWMAELPADSVMNTLSDYHRRSTLDNRNTYSQIEYLAQVYTLAKTAKYKDALYSMGWNIWPKKLK